MFAGLVLYAVLWKLVLSFVFRKLSPGSYAYWFGECADGKGRELEGKRHVLSGDAAHRRRVRVL